jgi:hypothetical protein
MWVIRRALNGNSTTFVQLGKAPVDHPSAPGSNHASQSLFFDSQNPEPTHPRTHSQNAHANAKTRTSPGCFNFDDKKDKKVRRDQSSKPFSLLKTLLGENKKRTTPSVLLTFTGSSIL